MSAGFLPGLVVRNWRLKLAAFGLAVFLWAVVRTEPDRGGIRTVSGVPVRVEVGDLDWTTAGPPQPSAVDVRLNGDFSVFASPDDGLAVQVPIDRVGSRDTVVELRRDWVRHPGSPGFQVQDINPPRIRITFEETAEAAVPVSLETSGSIPEDVSLAQPLSVYPAVVRVRGRRSRVVDLDSLHLGPLDLSTVDESGSYTLEIDTAGFGDLSFSTTEANVEARLEEAVEQTFSGVLVRLDSVPAGVDTTRVTFRPPSVQVTLWGGRTRVAQADPAALQAVVPSRVVEALLPGEQRLVPLRLRGVPALVRAYASTDSVRVVRLDPGTLPDTLLPADTTPPSDTTAGAEGSGGGAGGRSGEGGRP